MTKTYQSSKKRHLFVDGGSFTFDTIFKTLCEYNSRKDKSLPSDVESLIDPCKDPIFNTMLEKNYVNRIKLLTKNHHVQYDNIVIACDRPRETCWRTNIYPEYKTHRGNSTKHKGCSYDMSNIFRNIYSNILPKIQSNFGINIIQIDHAEADDIISVLVRNLKPDNQAIIITSDNDYLQLLDRPETYIYRANGESGNIKLNGKSPSEKLYEKIILGDKSDNIDPFHPDKNFTKFLLSCEIDDINNIIYRDELLKEKFEKNRRLIDFNCIPNNIKDNIIKSYKSLTFYKKMPQASGCKRHS